MKINYLLTENINPNGSSGASAHIRENIKNLRVLGHTVILIHPDNDDCNSKYETSKGRFGKKLIHAVTTTPIRRVVANYRTRKQEYHLIHNNILKFSDCDVIYERDAFQAFEIYNQQKKLKKPWIIECNGYYWGALAADFHQPSFPKAYKRKHLQKWMSADHLIVVSSRFKEKMIHDGIQADKISVIHNGVDLKAYKNVDMLSVKKIRHTLGFDNEIVIGFIGSILPWHRVDMFLEAIRKLKNDFPIKGLIVGGGIWKMYQEKAKEMGLEKDVVFTGMVDPMKVPKMVSAMDICTLPGSTDYNSPVKLFDYGAAKKPVVAANFQAVSEILDDRKSGLLFSQGNLESYVNTLRELLNDKGLQNRLGNNLHANVSKYHSWEYVASQTNQIIEKVVHKNVQLQT
ncbi:MAG: glycosyltransferase family 4 protein [Balneolales bacterium]